MEEQTGDVTELLKLWRDGDEDAFDLLLPMVYEELHKVAKAYLRKERQDHTLQTTALVHEAYLRLGKVDILDAKDRSHFFAVAARAMRRILVDHARRQNAGKRIGAHQRLPLEDAGAITQQAPAHVLAIHEALEDLATVYPRRAKLVELRFFGGLTEAEASEVLGLGRSSINRDWRLARLWLYRRLEKD